MLRIAAALLVVGMSAVAGAAIAAWAVGDTNAFYMNPVAGYGAPAYARDRPVADSFWQAQDGDAAPNGQVDADSTATSAQPAYRSAPGS